MPFPSWKNEETSSRDSTVIDFSIEKDSLTSNGEQGNEARSIDGKFRRRRCHSTRTSYGKRRRCLQCRLSTSAVPYPKLPSVALHSRLPACLPSLLEISPSFSHRGSRRRAPLSTPTLISRIPASPASREGAILPRGGRRA